MVTRHLLYQLQTPTLTSYQNFEMTIPIKTKFWIRINIKRPVSNFLTKLLLLWTEKYRAARDFRILSWAHVFIVADESTLINLVFILKISDFSEFPLWKRSFVSETSFRSNLAIAPKVGSRAGVTFIHLNSLSLRATFFLMKIWWCWNCAAHVI